MLIKKIKQKNVYNICSYIHQKIHHVQYRGANHHGTKFGPKIKTKMSKNGMFT
jgi:hypothetical protein